MMLDAPSHSPLPGLTVAVRRRQRALLQRLIMGSASAVVFSPLLGWGFSLIWVGLYFIIQLLEALTFRPIITGKVERLGRARTVAGGAILLLNAAFFGSLSLPLWQIGGPMGGVCAAILLTAGAIHSVINATGSLRVLVLTAAPQLAYLALTPVFMTIYGAPPHFVTAGMIAVFVFATFCVNTWQHLDRAGRAEKLAQADADRKRMQAENAMAGRSAFLAAVAHDLRTPISAILAGAAELDRGVSAGSRSHVALISDAGMMMKALLDDLLDHARLDAGRMTVTVADFDFRALLAQTARLWHGPVKAKGLHLRMEGAREAPRALRGDAMRLRQVLNNLISNAVKFTDAGGVTLRIRAWRDEPGGYAVVLEISDTGPGMTPSQIQRLFKPFDQTAEGIAAQYGGSGLGLAISYDLINLMGGRLTARSRPGQGSSFTLSLILPEGEITAVPAPAPLTQRPVILASPPEAPEPQLPVSPVEQAVAVSEPDTAFEHEDGEDRPLRVLVVDDHDINRRAIQLILQPLGCDMTMAADGLQALDASAARPFDLIFMDVRMPELDGRETTRRLRAADGPNRLTPVIAVTADTAPDDIAACMAAGMTYFVSKPLTPAALLGAVSEVLSGVHDVDSAAA